MNARSVRTLEVGFDLRERTFADMNYVFQFGDVWAARWGLLWGSWLTIQLSASAMRSSMEIASLRSQ